MTDIQNPTGDSREERRRERWERRRGRRMGIYQSSKNSLWTGLLILLIGVVALMKAFLVPMPEWLFSWPTLLLLLGFFLAIRHNFHGVAWLILMLVGGVFLLERANPDISMRQYTWPLVLIVVGLFIILRPRHRRQFSDDEKKTAALQGGDPVLMNETYSQEDFVDATSIFGGTKKNIISKNFKGGDLVNIFGGSEINLTQADFTGTAVIELTTIFGGTTLIVPSNWSVQSEAVTIFGGMEDKRSVAEGESRDKLLLIKGTVLFGGIDIKSYK
jgi:predicted membrane protein